MAIKYLFEERKTRAHFNLNQNFTFSKNHRTRKRIQPIKIIGLIMSPSMWVNEHGPTLLKQALDLKVNSIEHLILTLQDKYKTDNIAVMIFLNGFSSHCHQLLIIQDITA